MGIQGALGQAAAGNEPFLGCWGNWADPHSLPAAAASWEACPADAKDAFRNRQFLATFTIELVQWFRAEEAKLKQTRSPHLVSRRREHHRLALRLRELMAEADLGLEVVSGIQAFLQEWRFHQEWIPSPTRPPEALGH
jgi:hypothetical protein